MSSSQPTYHSSLYQDFKEIDASAYREIIAFYEEHETETKQIPFEESLEIFLAYVNALFETANYKLHLEKVDQIIEMSILRNIQYFKGEDIYRKMLFKKAASLYNIHEYDRADYILRELVKIDPKDKDSVYFLKKCLRRKRPPFVRHARAVSILLFLVAAIIICIEVLYVRPFRSQYVNGVEMSRFIVFGAGVLLLAGSEVYHRWRVQEEVMDFIRNASGKRQNPAKEKEIEK